jgi:hypothetical protein
LLTYRSAVVIDAATSLDAAAVALDIVLADADADVG